MYVSEVKEGSDAFSKGLLAGDIILAINGDAVRSVAQINAVKDDFSVGDTITLTVYRDGDTFDLDITLVDSGDLE